jgi:hypothetical protein
MIRIVFATALVRDAHIRCVTYVIELRSPEQH